MGRRKSQGWGLVIGSLAALLAVAGFGAYKFWPASPKDQPLILGTWETISETAEYELFRITFKADKTLFVQPVPPSSGAYFLGYHIPAPGYAGTWTARAVGDSHKMTFDMPGLTKWLVDNGNQPPKLEAIATVLSRDEVRLQYRHPHKFGDYARTIGRVKD